MSIAQRREAVRFLSTQGVSVQRACVLVQLQRASFQYQPRSIADDGVESEIAALAKAHPRYGYRRVTQRVPGAAAAQTYHQSQARPSAVEACSFATPTTKTSTPAP
jgi:hypothetical protein